MSSEPITSVIHAEGITKRFGSLEVLKGVSLDAPKGSVTSLIGASGSGKSTFLRCLNLLEEPNGGSLKIEGSDIPLGVDTRAHREAVRKARMRVGMVFQSFNLWDHMTALENVAEGPRHVLGLSKVEANERSANLLRRVGLDKHLGHYPQHLSGGQKQRVAIARALAMEPAAILFDEPTSALDPELVMEVLRVIEALAEEGTTMLIVTHEMAFARNVSTNVAFLKQGLIAEEGPPAQLFDTPQDPDLQRFLQSVH
jgi:ABC-type histidine transport system ATPase subunit